MFLTCLCACIALAAAAIPQRCCVDHRYEVTLGQFGGTLSQNGDATLLNGYNHMSYDYYSRMMRMENHMISENGTETVSEILIDYRGGKEYVKTDMGCTVIFTTEKMIEPCLPASATFRNTQVFGYGDKTLTVNRWKYVTTDTVVSLAVTEDGCVPFAETIYGTINNATSDVVYFISNFHPGIKDPSVFVIPKNCQPGEKPSEVVGRAVRAMTNMF